MKEIKDNKNDIYVIAHGVNTKQIKCMTIDKVLV